MGSLESHLKFNIKCSGNYCNIDEVKTIYFQQQMDKQAALTIFNAFSDIPFKINRVFTIQSEEQTKRGAHSHYECKQLLVCLQGCIEVKCEDGVYRKTYLLDSPQFGLYVPPSIWSEQVYLESNTILVVFCDLFYDESDYIRNYTNFLKLRHL